VHLVADQCAVVLRGQQGQTPSSAEDQGSALLAHPALTRLYPPARQGKN
jgi:hypothetical protein